MPINADPNERFINPYNFIPLGTGKKTASSRAEEITGYIKCTLTPRTDLFVPNTSNYDDTDAAQKKHKKQVFFSYDDLSGLEENVQSPEEPVIPGSELRGLLRSAYEALTDSCLWMDFGKEYKRSPNYKQPGILLFENGQWTLYPAENVKLPRSKAAQADVKTGDIVPFQATPKGRTFQVKGTLGANRGTEKQLKDKADKRLEAKQSPENIYGVVLIGEYVQGKKREHSEVNEHIFVLSPSSQSRAVPSNGAAVENAKQRMEEALKYYRDKNINANLDPATVPEPHNGYPGYLELMQNCQHPPIPVWWEKDDKGNLYFSPASRGKDVPIRRWEKLVKSYAACKDKSGLCPTCALFGTVEAEAGEGGQRQQSPAASRIRVTDAEFCGSGKPAYGKEWTLAELSAPKPNAVEFYTHFPGCEKKAWNLDFHYKGNDRDQAAVDVNLNGRKFYLHHIPQYNPQEPQTERNQTVTPLQGGGVNQFTFKVYFDRISQQELKRLLVILSCGDNKDNHLHKLGHGKPLGLGSVKITVDGVYVREVRDYLAGGGLTDVTRVYQAYFSGYFKGNEDVFETDPRVVKTFRLLTDFDRFINIINKNKKVKVSYPLAWNKKEYAVGDNCTEEEKRKAKEKASAVYQWFSAARESSREHEPEVALPLAENAVERPEKLIQPKLIKDR